MAIKPLSLAITAGKYKGKKVTDVLRTDPGYYSWILQGDFARNTKQILTQIRLDMNKA